MNAVIAVRSSVGRFAIPALLTLVTLGSAIAGLFWLSGMEREAIYRDLAAMAEVRGRTIEAFLDERRRDAAAMATDASFAGDVARCIHSLGRQCDRRMWQRLVAVIDTYGYRSAMIVDGDGAVFMSAGSNPAFDDSDRETLARLADHQAAISDIHWSAGHAKALELDVAAPVIEDGHPVAYVLLSIDPERALFRLLRHGLNSEAMECVLARRDGGDALYLSPVSGGEAAPLRLRVPLTSTDAVAFATMGQTGILDADDHQGRPVIAAAKPIGGTPWVLVTSIGRDEVWKRAQWAAGLVVMIAGAFAVLLASWARAGLKARDMRWQLQYAQEQTERRALATHFEWIRKFGNDIVLLVDGTGRLLDANDRAEQAYGYSRDELMGLTIHELRCAETETLISPPMLDAGHGQGEIFRTHHRRKDGSEFPVEDSVRALVIDGRRLYQDIVRDITDRVAAEQRIEKLTAMYRTLSQTNKVIVRATERQKLFEDFCANAITFGPFLSAWVALREGDRGLRIVAASGPAEEVSSEVCLSLDPASPYSLGPSGTAVLTGEGQYVNDMFTDERVAAWRSLAESAGARSGAAIPILEGGKIVGAFTVFASRKDFFDEEILSLLKEVAGDLSFGLDMLHHEGLRRRAEEELRQSRARVGALVNDHPGLICRFRRDGTLTFVNPAYSKMFGRSADELIGTSFLDLIPPGDRDAVQANIDSLGHENPTVTYVHRAIGAAGEIHWQEWTDRALFDDRGNIVEYQSAGRDITAERATQQALRDSEEMLSAMMEAISDALVVMDERGHVAFWNTSAEKILGHRREDAIGHDVHDLIARPTDAQSFRLALPHFADTGSGPVIGQMLELAAKRADGSEFPVELSVNSFRFRDRWHAVGIMRDISDRKELERRLWQSEKMEALGNLAGGIAHDVNNMLQPVIGFAAMLHADFPEESPERSHAGIILQAAQRIKALVERILAFSRKEDVKLQVFDLAQAMREGLDMARSMTPTNITIDTQIDGRVNTIVADPSQMQAILLNLVANAVDAIGPRPGTISVKLRRRVADAGLIEVFPDLKEGNDYVWIEVADTGCGIDANSLTRVFDPFYTTKPAGEGTGLGLSIVHGLVTKFGGAITVDSVVGRGTRFTIYLPLAPRSLFS